MDDIQDSPMLILTLFSIPDPISYDSWTHKIQALLPALQKHLNINTDHINRRHLDLPTSTSQSSDLLSRVAELSLPLSSTPAPSQKECTSLLHTHFISLCTSLGLHPVLQPLTAIHKLHSSLQTSNDTNKASMGRLIAFDLDSTLTGQEAIDELARLKGKECFEKVAQVTERAMADGAPFNESLRLRCWELKGLKGDCWDRLLNTNTGVIKLTQGAREVVQVLKSDGWTTACFSGGFVQVGEWVKKEIGLDYVFANALEVDKDGTLTGGIVNDDKIVDADMKRLLLIKTAKDIGLIEEGKSNYSIETGIKSRTVAVGDGSNDLLMMDAAGLGIAFNGKQKVRERAPAVVPGQSLIDILHVLGWTDEEIQKKKDRKP